MSRKSIILITIIVLFSVVFIILKNKQPIQKTVKAFDIDSLQVNKFVITSVQDTLVLVKNNNHWVIANLENYPANLEKVTQLFSNIVNLQRSKKILSDNSEDLERYKLTPNSGTNIQIYSQDNLCLLDIFIGTSDLYTYSCMRKANESIVYELADNVSEFIFPKKDTWQDPYIFRYKEPDLMSIQVVASVNKYSLTRKDKDWIYKNESEEFPVYTSNRSLFKILNVLKSLKTFNIVRLTPEINKKYLNRCILKLTLTIKNSDNYVLSCYEYNDDDSIVIFSGNQEYAFFVPYDFVNRFTKSPQNFKDYSENTY